MKCKKCGEEISDSARFCPECGARQIEGKVCPECRKINVKDAKFCMACGKKLVNERKSKVAEKKKESPLETKPAENKPIEDKTAENKPVENKPLETKPEKTKPVENKTEEKKKNVPEKKAVDPDKIIKAKNPYTFVMESFIAEDDVVVYGPEFV